MKKLLISFILLLSHLALSAAVIGEWRVHPAFGNATDAETAGNKTYVLDSGSLYCYNANDQSVTVFDKAKTLSDCDIKHIAWCQAARRLVIAYANQNIDLLEENGNVINISDYYSKVMTVDKTINGINVVGRYAYLCTAFGVIRINVAEALISDTYNIGISVDWTHVDNRRIYAESKQSGQYSALLTSNLIDRSSWSRTADYTAENKQITAEQKVIIDKYRPEGPELNQFGYMRMYNGKLYTVAGYSSPARKAYIQIKEKDKWTVISNDIGYISQRSYVNPYMIEIDPKDESHWFVPARTGLYEYKNNKVINDYYWGNSPLQLAATVKPDSPYKADYTLATSALFDNEGAVWVFNGIAPTPKIYKLDKDGKWDSFSHPEMKNTADYSWERQVSAFFDSRGEIWFVNNDWRTPVLARYDIKTDRLKAYKSLVNQDGMGVNFMYVRCCVEDRYGNIWFGTNIGPFEYLATDVTSDTEVFQQIKVPRNDGTNLADYLLSGIDITCIAIDAANRKWFGTNDNGIYLIDYDNTTQIHHFTASNSPLLSNNIESIAIDDTTGEVYIATDKGLCSYASDASGYAERLVKDNIYAYPNPVTPDYTGLITIVGLTYRSEVKIVTSSGQIVAEGTSNGGTFTWDGCDINGKRVASGVYMVMVATEEGKKGIVTKVAIVR